MSRVPELDLNQISPDPDLVRRVPYDVAMYYLAVPVAQESGSVSVAMAHPENRAAVATLQDLLRAEIVPLRCRPDTIRSLIKQLQTAPVSSNRILTWSASAELAPVVQQAAVMVGNCLPAAVPILDARQASLPTILSIAGAIHPKVTILAPPAELPLPDLLLSASAPLVLIRGPLPPLRRVLVVVRGFASDARLLDLALPVLRKLSAQVVLLPVSDPDTLIMNDLLCADHPVRQHVDGLLHRLDDEQVDALLRIRAGDPAAQVVTELQQGAYDLLIIAAEASGQFVARVLHAVDQEACHVGRPVFIIKPAYTFRPSAGFELSADLRLGDSTQ